MHSQDYEKRDDTDIAIPDRVESNDSKTLTDPQETQEPAHQSEQIAPPPDGGYGWVCTISCATINAHTWGM